MKRSWEMGLCGLSSLFLGCASAPPVHESRPADDDLSEFAQAAQVAIDSNDVELPNRARSLGDIRLITRAYDNARGCVPGRSRFSAAWVEARRDRRVQTSLGSRTIGELASACSDMLADLEHRSFESCGSRFVQVERFSEGARRWSPPHVARASDGWYMTPCDQHPGAGVKLKDAEAGLRSVCDDPSASMYMLARWSEEPGASRSVATIACMLPLQSRSDWLPGNPALGVK